MEGDSLVDSQFGSSTSLLLSLLPGLLLLDFGHDLWGYLSENTDDTDDSDGGDNILEILKGLSKIGNPPTLVHVVIGLLGEQAEVLNESQFTSTMAIVYLTREINESEVLQLGEFPHLLDEYSGIIVVQGDLAALLLEDGILRSWAEDITQWMTSVEENPIAMEVYISSTSLETIDNKSIIAQKSLTSSLGGCVEYTGRVSFGAKLRI